MYKRTSFRVYVYERTLDGKTDRIETPRKIDYAKEIKKARLDGHKLSFKFIKTYIWNE